MSVDAVVCLCACATVRKVYILKERSRNARTPTVAQHAVQRNVAGKREIVMAYGLYLF